MNRTADGTFCMKMNMDLTQTTDSKHQIQNLYENIRISKFHHLSLVITSPLKSHISLYKLNARLYILNKKSDNSLYHPSTLCFEYKIIRGQCSFLGRPFLNNEDSGPSCQSIKSWMKFNWIWVHLIKKWAPNVYICLIGKAFICSRNMLQSNLY